MLCLSRLLLVLFLLKHDGYIIIARQTLLGRAPKSYVMAISNISVASPLTQIYSSSHVTCSAIQVLNSSHSVINFPTVLPIPFYPYIHTQSYVKKVMTNYLNAKSGSCAIEDGFCAFKDRNGTIIEAIITNFFDQCLLWDASCSGNRTLVIDKFFDVTFSDQFSDDPNENGNLMDNDCFSQDHVANQSDCDTYNPSKRLSENRR